VKRAQAAGFDAIAVPLFQIEPVPWQLPDTGSFDGLLLTSANAVRFAGDQLQQLRQLRVYAVGDATGEAARDAGFDIASTGTSGVERLLGSIDSDLRLLHLCGADRHEPEGAKQAITAVTVYRATALETADLSNAAESVALVHSPRAGRRFAELIEDKDTIAIAAISAATAEAMGSGWKRVEAVDTPTDEALLALATRLCNNSPPE
jgi:uroporphyrinogen-III synthase